MDHSWIKAKWTSVECDNGVRNFLDFTRRNVDDDSGMFYCPLIECLNEKWLSATDIYTHLINKGKIFDAAELVEKVLYEYNELSPHRTISAWDRSPAHTEYCNLCFQLKVDCSCLEAERLGDIEDDEDEESEYYYGDDEDWEEQ